MMVSLPYLAIWPCFWTNFDITLEIFSRRRCAPQLCWLVTEFSSGFNCVGGVANRLLTGTLLHSYGKSQVNHLSMGNFFSSIFHSFLKYPEDTGTYRNHFRVRHVLTQGESLIPPSGCLRWLRSCGTLFLLVNHSLKNLELMIKNNMWHSL